MVSTESDSRFPLQSQSSRQPCVDSPQPQASRLHRGCRQPHSGPRTASERGAADLRGALRGSLSSLPQLAVQQRLHAVAAAVAAQRLQLLQVLPLLQGQALGAGEQAAPWGTQTTARVIGSHSGADRYQTTPRVSLQQVTH